MPDQVADGNTRVWWVPNIADPALPLIAELSLGTDLSCALTADGLIGFEPDTEGVDATGTLGRFRTQRRGRASFSGTKLRLKKQAQIGDAVYGLLAPGAEGYVVVRRDAAHGTAWANGQACEVYPVETGETANLPPEANSMHKYEVPLFIHDLAEIRAIVGGLAPDPGPSGGGPAANDAALGAEANLSLVGQLTEAQLPDLQELAWASDWDAETTSAGFGIRGTVEKTLETSSGSLTVTQADFDVPPLAGDVLLAFAYTTTNDLADGSTTFTTPAGWTSLTTGAVTNGASNVKGGTKVARKIAGAAEGSYVFDTGNTVSQQVICVVIYAIEAADNVTPEDGAVPAPTTSTSLATSVVAPAVTTARTDSMLFCGHMAAWTVTGTSSFSTPTGMIEDADLQEPATGLMGSMAASHKQLSAAGSTGTQSSTVSHSAAAPSSLPRLTIGASVAIGRAPATETVIVDACTSKSGTVTGGPPDTTAGTVTALSDASDATYLAGIYSAGENETAVNTVIGFAGLTNAAGRNIASFTVTARMSSDFAATNGIYAIPAITPAETPAQINVNLANSGAADYALGSFTVSGGGSWTPAQFDAMTLSVGANVVGNRDLRLCKVTVTVTYA